MTTEQQTLEDFIHGKLTTYFDQLQGKVPCNVYNMVIKEAETAVIRYVIEHCNYNQSKASKLLGISRGALRYKIQKYGI